MVAALIAALNEIGIVFIVDWGCQGCVGLYNLHLVRSVHYTNIGLDLLKLGLWLKGAPFGRVWQIDLAVVSIVLELLRFDLPCTYVRVLRHHTILSCDYFLCRHKLLAFPIRYRAVLKIRQLHIYRWHTGVLLRVVGDFSRQLSHASKILRAVAELRLLKLDESFLCLERVETWCDVWGLDDLLWASASLMLAQAQSWYPSLSGNQPALVVF